MIYSDYTSVVLQRFYQLFKTSMSIHNLQKKIKNDIAPGKNKKFMALLTFLVMYSTTALNLIFLSSNHKKIGEREIIKTQNRKVRKKKMGTSTHKL